MTTRHVLVAAAAATVIAVTSACGTSSTPSASSSQSPSATMTRASVTASPSTTMAGPSTPAPDVLSACTELGGTVGSDGVCTVHTETPGYTVDMSFPTDYPDQRALTDLLTHHRDQFVAFAEEPPVRNVPHALDMQGQTYRSGAPSSGTESLVFEVYADTGGAHPNTAYSALNYDLAKQAPITFEALFRPGSDPVAVLDPIVKAEFEKRLDGTTIDDNLLGAKTYQNFALQDEAVIFFIGQGMWAFEAAGPQQFSIPRSDLASILA